MINIFITIVFLAELIIAVTIVCNIIKIDQKINTINNSLNGHKTDIKLLLVDIRDFLRLISDEIIKLKAFVIQKRNEYTLKALKTSLIYLCIFLLRGKYKKAVFAYQIGREIYDGFCEANTNI